MSPGTIVFSVFWSLLTAFGSVLISSRLVRANQLYGTIGFVIGLIFWIYLGAYGALLATELNVVRAHRLYPRSWSGIGAPRTTIDRKALRERARTEGALPGPGRRGALRGSFGGTPVRAMKPRATASSMRGPAPRPRAPLTLRRCGR